MKSSASATIRWERPLLAAVLVLLAALALHPLGVIVLLVPLGLGLLGVMLFYCLLLWTSNPGSVSIAERWADGQPSGRAAGNEQHVIDVTHELEEKQEQAEHQLDQARTESAETSVHHDPADYEGPPAIVPFP